MMAHAVGSNPDLTNDDYTVGWMCALKEELAASRAMLDEEHPRLTQVEHDNNSYTLGRIGRHNVVLTCLPSGALGAVPAAIAATNMLRSFPRIRFGLMVGIGGGVAAPPSDDPEEDIRLGDAVVSHPTGTYGGVVQYDYGKLIRDGKFKLTGSLNKPPTVLLNAINDLRARHEAEENQILRNISKMLESKPKMRKRYQHPGSDRDILYAADYPHIDSGPKPCEGCDHTRGISRGARDTNSPIIHYGLIGSANQVIKDGPSRELLRQQLGVLCVEMEAAGLMADFPCLVIRGISDYYKNDIWQPYAAAVAAAYAKELLETITPSLVNSTEEAAKRIELLKGIQTTTLQTQRVVQNLEANSHIQQLRNWLLPPDPSTNYNKALQQRHPGSGRWFLESSAFSTWKAGIDSFLWLHGIPGCGKTILSSTIIENLERDKMYAHSILYFYFDFNDRSKQSLDNAIKSLVSQMYTKHENCRQHLDLLYSSCENGHRQPSTESLCVTFQTMVQQVGEIWIVLDALDECPKEERSQTQGLLSRIEGWVVSRQVNVHLLVTSRPEQDIKSTLQCCVAPQNIIPIKSDLIMEDIQAYVRSTVRLDAGLSRWRSQPEVQNQIESALIEKADGMFRWVSCQLDALRECLNYPLLQSALRSLPKTLDETYSRILQNIPCEYKQYTWRVLQFLAFSERPLRLEEAVDMIIIDVHSTPRFNPKHRMPVPEEISQCCSSLVYFTTRYDDLNKEPITEMQLAHFSVKEYLTSDGLDGKLVDIFKEAVARASIADICLSYLLELDNSLSTEMLKQRYPFAQYSAQYWAANARVAETGSKQASTITMEFFSNWEAFAAGNRLFRLDPRPPRLGPGDSLVRHPLYYAALAGLNYSIRAMLAQGADVNMWGGFYGSALCAAAGEGHLEIVQTLIKGGADMNADNGWYGNALQAASYRGHLEIINVLLENGANINTKGGNYGNALQAALFKGNITVAKTLIEKGANVNAEGGEYRRDAMGQGGQYRNALEAALLSNRLEVVQTLIEHGADISARVGPYNNALEAVSSQGHLEIVRMLIKSGADVNAQGPDPYYSDLRYGNTRYGSALHAACQEGHLEIARVLVENGAKTNACGGIKDNALHTASWEGHVEIVRMLLENGADVNNQGGAYGNPLQAASLRGHVEVVQILIKNGANVNAQGGVYRNALCAASLRGHHEIVRILVENGVDVNALGKDNYSAPHAASSRGHLKIVQTLVENGADINSQKVLQVALSRGYQDIVQTLVKNGANVNTSSISNDKQIPLVRSPGSGR